MLVVMLVSAGCVTPYGPRGLMGGYVDWPTGSGRHHIEVSGNGYTSATTLRMQLHERALELCHEDGFEGYDTLSQDAESRVSETPRDYSVDRFSGEIHESGGYRVRRSNVIADVACTGATSTATR